MASSAEELCESEVLWPEAPHDDDGAGDTSPSCSSSPAPPRRSVTPAREGAPDDETPRRAGSRPVDIPRPARSAALIDDDDYGRSGTIVPPHVLVSRRRPEGAAAAFALRSGPGRARELSHLRNSVLRMTGFIEG